MKYWNLHKSIIFGSAVIALDLFLTVSCAGLNSDDSNSASSKAKPDLAVAATAFELSGKTTVDNFKLHWNSVEHASYYTLARSDSAGGAYADIVGKSKAMTSTMYDVYDAGTTTYYYKVAAYNAYGLKIAESDSVKCEPFSDTTSLTYDNTAKSSLSQPTTLKFGDVYYQYVYTNTNGCVSLTEQTSSDGLTFSGTSVVITGDPSDTEHYNSALASCKLESTCYAKKGDEVVIWSHYENAKDYSLGEIYCISGVPGSGKLTGDAAGYHPQGHDSRDLTMFIDDDGKAYLISATDTNTNLRLYRLADSWKKIDPTFTALYLCKGQNREAPCLIKNNGWYYLFSSEAAGWYPSLGKYCAATTIGGLVDADILEIGNRTTFGGQSGQVAKIGGTYLMMANRWSGGWAHPDPVLSSAGYWSSQRMLPISMSSGYAFYDYFYNVKYDCTSGTVVPVQDGYLASLNGATGKSDASASGYSASEAVDGISCDYDDSYYNPSATSGTYNLVVDLGKPYKIGEVDVTFRVYKGSEVYNKYTIAGSNDGSTFTTIKDNSSNYIIGFCENVMDASAATAYRFVRVQVTGIYRNSNDTSLDASWVRGIHELSVYGTPEE